jgi:hypothetical protein
MSQKGVEVYNDYHRFLLVHGARRTGKTIALCDKVIRHMWENNGAIVAIIARTLRAGEQGVWGDLIRPTDGRLYVWANNTSMEIVKEPTITNTTKVSFFRIRNAHGGVSECQLHSLEFDEEVETKFKGFKCSMIQMVEADNFKDAMVFKTLTQTMRLLKFGQQQFILDTNPPKEGTSHWLHDEFFKNPTKHHKQIQFKIDDNPFISQEEKEELYALYKDSPNLLARYYFSEWVEARNEGSVFEDVYHEPIHIIHTVKNNEDSEEDWELLCPAKDAHTIHCGWDLGDRSSAFVMAAPRIVNGLFAFDVLDEIIWLNETNRSISDFTDAVLELEDFWERRLKSMYGRESVLWCHWSDSSSMSQSMTIGGTEAQLVYKHSDRKISLRPVTKGGGSVADRKNLLHRLLFEERIFVPSHCTHLKDMLELLPPGKGNQSVDPKSPHKHSFDALTYMLSCAVPNELNRSNRSKVSTGKRVASTMMV